ncbi:acyltransferase family protein [Ramlibacter albus]|uniref:Acyltransferase n=1 Tax=Ramlibacter albus TaxID=2079448 RepID=A0A923S2H1_9BURK|nr:acyltransferase [Ramlibacter albus]MBC5764753.1 acyltransferase [Ramlibacter albus]
MGFSVSDRSGEDAAIEGLRGLAALIVVGSHYAHLVTGAPGAWGFAATGVDLFFVLSGYVFAPYFFGRPLAWGPHLVRRFFRLYPLYLVALALYVLLKLPDPAATKYVVDHVFMAHTLRSLEIAFFYNAAFWSLPPEVEFYLLLPVIAATLRGRAFAALFVFALLMHMALIAVAQPGQGVTSSAIASVHLPGVLVEFALGACAWRIAREGGGRMLRVLLGCVALVAMCAVYTKFVAPDPKAAADAWPWISGNIGLGAALGYALVVSGVAARPNPQGWRLRLCLLAGELSYGVYLFHNALPQMRAKFGWPIEGWTAVGLCLAATLLLAWVLHHALEAPARNFGRDLSRRIAARQPA